VPAATVLLRFGRFDAVRGSGCNARNRRILVRTRSGSSGTMRRVEVEKIERRRRLQFSTVPLRFGSYTFVVRRDALADGADTQLGPTCE
jgi:hypothetical protein